MDPLWVDKHRPRSLEKLTFHHEITEVLGQLAETSDFPVQILWQSIWSFMVPMELERKQEPMHSSPKFSETMFSGWKKSKGC